MKKVEIESLPLNWVDVIHNDWAVICVDSEDKVNGMTVNWVQMGWLWNKPVVTLYVRPQRYTYPFMNEHETYSLAFFDEKYRKEITYLGRVSGRDEDKLAVCGFTTSRLDNAPIINQAKMVFTIKKLYESDLKKTAFCDQNDANKNYPNEDYHRVYVGEIVATYINE